MRALVEVGAPSRRLVTTLPCSAALAASLDIALRMNGLDDFAVESKPRLEVEIGRVKLKVPAARPHSGQQTSSKPAEG